MEGILSMNNAKMHYFEKEDILHLIVSDEPEANSVEISPNITAELNDEGELTALVITVRDSRILSLPYLPFRFCPRWISKTLYWDRNY